MDSSGGQEGCALVLHHGHEGQYGFQDMGFQHLKSLDSHCGAQLLPDGGGGNLEEHIRLKEIGTPNYIQDY